MTNTSQQDAAISQCDTSRGNVGKRRESEGFTINESRRLRIGDIVISANKRQCIFIDGVPKSSIVIENVKDSKLKFNDDPAQRNGSSSE